MTVKLLEVRPIIPKSKKKKFVFPHNSNQRVLAYVLSSHGHFISSAFVEFDLCSVLGKLIASSDSIHFPIHRLKKLSYGNSRNDRRVCGIKQSHARYRTLGKWLQQVTHTKQTVNLGQLGAPSTGLHASFPLFPAVGVSKDEMRQSIKKQGR